MIVFLLVLPNKNVNKRKAFLLVDNNNFSLNNENYFKNRVDKICSCINYKNSKIQNLKTEENEFTQIFNINKKL